MGIALTLVFSPGIEPPRPPPPRELTGRQAECAVLDRLTRAVNAGESRVLVLHGEAGVGKTALLDYLAGHAPGCQVARVAGVQSEMELPFAGLHQLCGPLMSRLGALPAPQRDALRITFGQSAGPTPDRFLVGLAVLSLLSHVARERPLLCVIDDFHWLDRTSGQVLAFAARRLGAESVGMVFAIREQNDDLASLPDLEVASLPANDAGVLLDAALPGPVDRRVRDQLIAETRGNPLALLELPRGLTPGKLAGGFGLPAATPLADSVERNFQQRIDDLPLPTQRLLLLAAADPSGDPALFGRAPPRLGIDTAAAVPAVAAGLAEFGTRLVFRHPLARSAAYQRSSITARHEAHRALADATDDELDPDRRAWHRARATPGPDEDVAAELEDSASRARARGGTAAAAAFLERATELTPDPAKRAARALAAAQAKTQAGAYDAAAVLLDAADTGPLTGWQRAHVSLARAQLAYFTRRGPDGPPLLLDAARQLASVDPALSRATYLDALTAAMFVGRLARPGYGVFDVARAIKAAPPPPGEPRPVDLLLDGLAAAHNDGFAVGTPLVREALRSFGDGMPAKDQLHWLWRAGLDAGDLLCDESLWDELSARHVRLSRDTGALSELPRALTSRAYLHVLRGELDTAASLAQEALAGIDATKMGLAPALWVAALRGEEARAEVLTNAIMEEVARRGEGVAISWTEWTNALLNNGLSRYDKAAALAWHSCTVQASLGPPLWLLPELIEAATRTGMTEAIEWGRFRIEEATRAYDTDWGLGIGARCLALLTEGEAAEELYREAVTRLGRTGLRVELARAHLLYGEWLRRERRRTEARDQLRTAHGLFAAMGASGFAERARRELGATGETARKRVAAARDEELTAQEALIARLARDGLSNPEIGTRLFLSAHTVQYHLRKIFQKLGVTSRSQLHAVLPSDTASA
jgi:DNA-binding CsgD family transcriptional regulator